jgi:hypothetical protein
MTVERTSVAEVVLVSFQPRSRCGLAWLARMAAGNVRCVLIMKAEVEARMALPCVAARRTKRLKMVEP